MQEIVRNKRIHKNVLRDQFLFEYGLTYNDILFEHRERADHSKSKSQLFHGDNKGNMLIYYPSLDGFLEQSSKKGKMHDTYRVRLLKPFYNKENKPVKYLMEGFNCIFYPPLMIQAFKAGSEIETLIVTEGEKKAFVASKNGFDCVGISGIWNFCNKENLEEGKQDELMPSLKEFIKKCKVKNVVLLHDSDALDISKNPNDAATDRVFGFYQATKRFAELIFQEGVKFYYGYINPHIEASSDKLGLDDLIKKYEDYSQRVLLDFHNGVTENKFTSYFCIKKIEYIKEYFIKDIFLLNDAEEFYKHHKNVLKDRKEFRFNHQLFTINQSEGTIEEVKKVNRDNVWVTNGCYYGYDQRGNVKSFSNFTMNVLFLLRSTNNPKRIVHFKNILGQSCVKELTMDDFVSVSSFRKKLIADGSFIFKGEMWELLNLQEILFKEEKNASEITSLGWHKKQGFWAWSNGITANGKFYPVDEYGIVQFNQERFYLPAYSNLFTDADEIFKNERNFKHIDNDISFDTWAFHFHKAYKENGIAGICFYVAALFRDIIFDEFNEFPMLNLFGQKGSGKSTMAKSLMYMFGQPQNAISLENASSTKKGMYRKFSQFRNSFVWMDEYKNTIHPDLIGLLKNLYDGIGYERAQTTQDNRTHNNPVLSSAIISGQDMPTIDPALFTRVILLMFKQNSFNDTDKKHYSDIKEIEKKGLTHITNTLLAHRDLIAKNYTKEYQLQFKKIVEEFKYQDIPDRLLKNAAMLMAPVFVLIKESVIHFPCSVKDITKAFTDILIQHKNLLNDNQETSIFWEVVETLFDEGIISADKGDFRFIKDTIAVRFNRVFAAYSEKYRKMHGRNGLDKLTLTNYLRNSTAFVEINSSVRFRNIGITSAFIFNYKMINIKLYNDASFVEEVTEIK
ncbi:MAG: DUF3854 domain-containing protein [Bacteroidia bacterium]